MKRETVILIVAALLVGAAAAAGLTSTLLNGRHRDALLDHGNRVAETYELRYDTLSRSYVERGRTVTRQAEILDQIGETNADLTRSLEQAESTALNLTELLASVEVTGSVEGEAEDGTAQTVRILPTTTLQYERSRITLFGEIDLAPDRTYSGSLSLSADLWLGTAVSRLPSGELRIDAWSDVPEIRFTEVEVIDNLEDPLAPKGGGFFLFKPGTWLGVGLGAVGTLLLTGRIL